MSIGNLKDSGNLGNNFPWQLKMLQGLQGIYDEVKKPLTCLEDSVNICAPIGGFNVNLHDGTGNPITSTVVGPDRGIDVNIINALPLEINLDPGNDSVGIYGYTNIADPNSFTGIKVNASGQLDIRPLTCVDKLSLCFNDGVSDVTVSSTNPLPVNAIVTVPSALDTALFAFDITSGVNEALTTTETSPGTHALDVNLTTRLDCTTDSVAICDGAGNALGIGVDGSIAVNLIDSVNGTQAVVNSDGTQNNAIYGYDHTSLQNEQITSVGISATVQALDVNIANSVPTLDVAIVNPLGVQGNCDFAVSTALCQTQEDILTDIKTAVQPITTITPNIQISSGDAATAIAVAVYSVTFFNNGSVDVLVSFNGGGLGTYVNIPAGTSITMDAGGINNQYPANTFYYDTFTADPSGSLIVTYNS